MSSILVSFIIPHKGREHYLQETLESIASQEFDLSTLEVIVVTQNDRLTKKTMDFKQRLSLSVYTKPASYTISSLRNEGADNAKGRYLAFLDADIHISSNWVQCMIDTLNEKKTRVIASAVQINGQDAPPLEKIRTALSNAATDQNVSFLPGRNLFLTRDTFNRIGGFPPHLITCEDYYFTDRANQFGDLYYTSKASYIHLGEDKNYREMYKKEIWRGQSNLLSIRGRPVPLNELPSFILPIAILILFLFFVFSIITGHYILAATGFITMTIPVILYSLRLYMIAGKKVRLYDVVKFYLYYFPGRAIGTVAGLFKTVTSRSHHQ